MRNIYKLLGICLFGFMFQTVQGQRGAVRQIVTFSSISVTEQTKEDGAIYNALQSDSLEQTNEVGLPSLPVKLVQVAIPANAQIVGVKINEIEKREEQILNHKIQPVQRTIPVGFTNNQEEFIGISDYENISVYPQQPVEVVDNGYLRGIQIVTVAVYPCQYHVNNDKLEVYQSLDWSLEYELYETTGEKKSQIWNDSFLNALKAIVSNPQDVLTLFSTREQLRTASVNALNVHSQYIIVTSAELASSFNEFMAWKKRKGISIDLVTIEDIKNAYTGDLISGINDDAGKLRQFLSDAYQNGCEYVLLGGDINILPIRYAYYNYQFGGLNESQKNIPTDLYFSDFDGNWDSDKDGINLVYGEINF